MLADIQSKITQINIDILMTTPIDVKSRIKIRQLEDSKERIGIIACLPIDEINENDLNLIYD